jgi:hypothetical protein
MLTGELPFTGESVVEVLMKHAEEPPPKPTSLSPPTTGKIVNSVSAFLFSPPASLSVPSPSAARATAAVSNAPARTHARAHRPALVIDIDGGARTTCARAPSAAKHGSYQRIIEL